MPILVAVMGQTATGKTDLAEALARELDGQLVNADAFQAYRGMDIGTAKPADKAAYELLDIKDPKETYGVGEFCLRAQTVLRNLWLAGRNAIAVGGTGLYIRALFEGYRSLKPEPIPSLRSDLGERLKQQGLDALVDELRRRDSALAARIDLKNPVRVLRALERALDDRPPISLDIPPYRQIKLGLSSNATFLGPRIEARTLSMVQNGWVHEVKALLRAGYGPGDPGFQAIGYREIAAYLEGKTDLEGATATAIAETRRYAKRQATWLRSEPALIKLDPAEPDVLSTALEAIRSAMQ